MDLVEYMGKSANPYCDLLWEPDRRYPGASYDSIDVNGLFLKTIPRAKESFFPDSNLSTLVPGKMLCKVQTGTRALALASWEYLTAGAMISW